MLIRARVNGFCLLVAAMSVVGCDSSVNPCKLSGKVTYKDQPVSGGTITLVLADGNTFPINILADGSYVFPNLPEGSGTVIIETESINPEKKQEYRGAAGGGPASMYGGKSGAGGAGGKYKGQAPAGSPVPEGAKGNSPIYVKIPAKYSDKTKSGLAVTLKKGDNKQDFALTD